MMGITREDLLQMTDGMRELYGEGFRRGKIFTKWQVEKLLEDNGMLCTPEQVCDLNIELTICNCEKFKEKLYV
jgi:hypothetical protein